MFRTMFDDVGKKIKMLAKIWFWIMAVSSWVVGLYCLVEGLDGYGEMVLIGLAVAVGGTLVAWLSNVFMYAFGEIVDKLTAIERNTRGAAGATPASNEVMDKRLHALERLLADGLITQEEYQAKVREVCGG